MKIFRRSRRPRRAHPGESERGAVSVEYGVVAVFIAAVIVIAVFFLGQATNDNFECTGEAYSTSSTC